MFRQPRLRRCACGHKVVVGRRKEKSFTALNSVFLGNMANAEDIVQYIIDELSERGLPPLKTALVKFMYLADVESLREGLPRITDVDWILYKYGPYSFDLDRAIEHVVGRSVDEMTLVSLSGKLYKTYSSAGHEREFKLPPQ